MNDSDKDVLLRILFNKRCNLINKLVDNRKELESKGLPLIKWKDDPLAIKIDKFDEFIKEYFNVIPDPKGSYLLIYDNTSNDS